LSIAKDAITYGNVFLHLKGDLDNLNHVVKTVSADGLIVSTTDTALIKRIAALRLPCVNIANLVECHPLAPVVGNDEPAIGRVAAEYFLDRGFKDFAFFAENANWYFYGRREGFVSAVRKAGFECHLPPADLRNETSSADALETMVEQPRAAKWLSSLPRPLALFCPYDGYAREAIYACKLADLKVPEEVSVIGVDNDPVLCTSISPPIASVPTSATQIGSAALHLVLDLLHGKKPPREPIAFAPSDVVVRGSCSELAIEDRDVAAAVSFIRTSFRERLSVDDVADHVMISRRSLERKFLESLHRSPHDEIVRARIEHAKKLLSGSDLPLSEVARRSGMIRVQRLSYLLKQQTGLTPMQYRNRFGTEQ